MITLLYWNQAKKPATAREAVEGREEYDLLAVQEPWINKQTKQPYCPRSSRYHLVWGSGRAAIYVNKRIATSKWTSEAGEDWAAVHLQCGSQPLTIYSIYSPCEGEPNWASPLELLATRSPTGRDIIAGDMNLHHPLWDREGRTSPQVGLLLTLAERWNLRLLTPWGEPTRQGGPFRNSTLDHAWATEGLGATYLGPTDLTGSDHRSQLVQIEGTPTTRHQPGELLPGYSWALMDRQRVATEALVYLRHPDRATSPEELDTITEGLIANLRQIADQTVPRRKWSGGRAAGWWDAGCKEASTQARRAARTWRTRRTVVNEQTYKEAQQTLDETVRKAQRRAWRNAVAKASKDNKAIWKIERWARLKSHLPTDPPRIPDLETGDPLRPTATTHAGKADVLARRFFPNPTADLSTIRHPTWPDHSFHPRTTIRQEVTEEDVQQALKEMAPNKAPGEDWLQTGFLKACGRPFRQAIASIAEDSFRLEHFPRCFRSTQVVVLRKPGKTLQQQRQAGAWRPISLLSCVGKVIEALIGDRLADKVEAAGLLPEGQMGNRRQRSTELAIRVVTETVHTSWKLGGTASLLQLDLKGAFDTVNHNLLLDTLRGKGLQPWVIRWLRSYLEDRTARLVFDGETTERRPIRAGVPQGSPLSPILFILYISTLYDDLRRLKGTAVVGFADDTNILAFGRDTQGCCRRLEEAWRICDRWAATRGMQFEASKSELIHFTRAHAPRTETIDLGATNLEPTEDARFLGVWLDRKLRYKAHLGRIQKKMATQTYALTRLAAKTWGCSLARAREIYTKVIRSAIAYRASAYHTPTEPGGAPRGIAVALEVIQNDCLRVVMGAYKATQIRHLESEASCPPIDLYLNKRVADFEARLKETGKDQILRRYCEGTEAFFRRTGRTQAQTRAPGRSRVEPVATEGRRKSRWAARWTGTDTPDEMVIQEWRKRFEEEAAHHRWDRDLPAADFPSPELGLDQYELHIGLKKAESSMLTQARTGKIGLRAFLFGVNVPTATTPMCPCGVGEETVCHLITECIQLDEARGRLPQQYRTARDVRQALSDPEHAYRIVRWLLRVGRLQEYRVAMEIEGDNNEHSWNSGPRQAGDSRPLQRRKKRKRWKRLG